MRILFIAMTQSVHTARWINQLGDQGWDLHLFPSWDMNIHPQLAGVTIHGFKFKPKNAPSSATMEILPGSRVASLLAKSPISRIIAKALNSKRLRKLGFDKPISWLSAQRRLTRFLPDFVNDNERCEALAQVIQKIKPDIIHSMEIQHAGYLTLEAKKKIGGDFPMWVVTNWGADIHYFGKDPEHAKKIRETLEACDYYGCECGRDVSLGREFGFKGEVMPVLPNTGGFNFDYTEKLRQPGPISNRKVILLKGYQGWVYRALNGLQALEMCADVIKERGYRLLIYLASPSVKTAAQRFHKKTGIPVEFISYTSHENMLKLHGQARVSIGLSMSDAISTSFLEAIVMGSFPIQSGTSCANEWVTSGETAFLVDPEDVPAISSALCRALTDDALVDRASQVNGQLVRERLDYRKLRGIVVSSYEKIHAKEALQ